MLTELDGEETTVVEADSVAGESADDAAGFDGVMNVMVDAEMHAILIEEARLMDDQALETTILRRLSSGLDLAIALGPQLLKWRPIHRDARPFPVTVPPSTLEYLELASEEFGYDLDVLAATLIFDPSCRPLDVVGVEVKLRARRATADRALRNEPGKGNIYPVAFEMPGYQLVFIRMLAGRVISRAQVIEEALVALARQALATHEVAGFRLTGEAFDMASRMVAMATNLATIRNVKAGSLGARRW